MPPKKSYLIWGILAFIAFLSALLAGIFQGRNAQETAANGGDPHVQAAQIFEDLRSAQDTPSPQALQSAEDVQSSDDTQSPEDAQSPEDVQSSGDVQSQEDVQSSGVVRSPEALAVTDPPEVSPDVDNHEHSTYRFPFEDGRRVEVPEGSILENARASFARISEVILVR